MRSTEIIKSKIDREGKEKIKMKEIKTERQRGKKEVIKISIGWL